MHFNSLALASIALLPLIEAHGDGIPGAPRIFGRSSPMRVQQRQVLADNNAMPQDFHDKRQASTSTDGQCGPGFGSCAAGYCCSQTGWCGVGQEYCESPGCQFNYGPACDDNTVPPGTNTSTVARTRLGSILYGGAGIYDCTVPGTIAITYDDGPYIYTDDVLDVLKNYSAKATFFITGNNNGKGEIDNAALPWVATIQRAYAEGHQIASHTWTHPYLSNLTSAQRKQQMYSNEMALRNILGFFPTYMRPPYSDCTAESGCQTDMSDLGYHVTYFDVDTDDYDNDSPSLIQNAKNNFDSGIAGGTPATSEYLVIGHDIHNQTAHNLTAYMLERVLSLGYKPVTVGECLGDPEANWYRNSTGSVFTSSTSIVTTATSTSAAASPTASSSDGTCGGTTGFTCANSAFGTCCSAAGWCGSSAEYCGEGCQAGFGQCGINVSQSSSASSTAAAAAATGISTDATCGGTSGFTCQGSTFGNCCGVNGWCGSTDAYCSTGCQSGFGTCGSSSASSVVSAKVPVSTLATSAASSSVKVTSIVKTSSTSTAKTSTTSSSLKLTSTLKSTSSTKTTSTAKTTSTKSFLTSFLNSLRNKINN